MGTNSVRIMSSSPLPPIIRPRCEIRAEYRCRCCSPEYYDGLDEDVFVIIGRYDHSLYQEVYALSVVFVLYHKVTEEVFVVDEHGTIYLLKGGREAFWPEIDSLINWPARKARYQFMGLLVLWVIICYFVSVWWSQSGVDVPRSTQATVGLPAGGPQTTVRESRVDSKFVKEQTFVDSQDVETMESPGQPIGDPEPWLFEHLFILVVSLIFIWHKLPLPPCLDYMLHPLRCAWKELWSWFAEWRNGPTTPTPAVLPHPLSEPASTTRRSTVHERRRRQGSRRANRERQVVATAATVTHTFPTSTSETAAADDVSTDVAATAATGKVTLVLGEDLMYTNLALNASDPDDACPICLDLYTGEYLAPTYCAVLPCRHACCLPCLKSVEESRDPCPVCRQPFGRVVESAVHDIFLLPEVNNQVQLMEVLSLEDKLSIVRRLLHANRFVAFKLLRALEDLLIDSLPQQDTEELKFDAIDLTPQDKEQIYRETQRPVLRLREELRQAERELRALRSSRCDPRYRCATILVAELKQQVLGAIRNAQEDAYNQINSRGDMGTISNVTKECQVDFHGLHVKGAKVKFDELVLPILPVLGCIRVITGRGRRSASGVAVLKITMTNYIEGHPDDKVKRCIRWEPVAGNEGVIRVVWIGDPSGQA